MPVYLWLSLHDATPRVVAERRVVYCQTSFPFYKWSWRDFLFDYKIVLFAYTNSGLSMGRKPYQAVYTIGSRAVLASRPVSWAKSVATLSSHHGMFVIVNLMRKWEVILTGQFMKMYFVILVIFLL